MTNIWRRQWHPTPVLLPWKSRGWRSLEGCSPWGRWGPDTTERLHFYALEKEMATHSSVLAWRIPWMEEPGRLQSMGSLRVGYNWATSLSLFTFMHWRRKWQPTPVFLPGESQGWGILHTHTHTHIHTHTHTHTDWVSLFSLLFFIRHGPHFLLFLLVHYPGDHCTLGNWVL